MSKRILRKNILFKALLAGTCMFTLASPILFSSYQAHAATAYDISQYQGYLTPAKVKRLKLEVSFVIIRTQYGGLRLDHTFYHNAQLLQKYHVPYGVYGYSLYANPAQARGEAKTLYQRAPQARFFVNDIEQNNTHGTLNASTQAWANEIHSLTNRPAVLYTGESFSNYRLNQNTRNKYDAIWLAAYGTEPDPYYHYDLWQFSDDYYSRALGKALDADTFPDGNNKSLNFWIGNTPSQSTHNHHASHVKPINKNTAQAINKAQQEALIKEKAENSNDQNTIHQLQGKIKEYQNQVNKLSNRASNNASSQIQELKHQNSMQSKALQKDTKEHQEDNNTILQLKRTLYNVTQKTRNLLYHKNKVNIPQKSKNTLKQYYTHINRNYVIVRRKAGINIDTIRGRKIAHVKKGTILHLSHIKYINKRSGMITRAIGYYGWNRNGSARLVSFSSKKSDIRPYNYQI